jgi:hypothetical protein
MEIGYPDFRWVPETGRSNKVAITIYIWRIDRQSLAAWFVRSYLMWVNQTPVEIHTDQHVNAIALSKFHAWMVPCRYGL